MVRFLAIPELCDADFDNGCTATGLMTETQRRIVQVRSSGGHDVGVVVVRENTGRGDNSASRSHGPSILLGQAWLQALKERLQAVLHGPLFQNTRRQAVLVDSPFGNRFSDAPNDGVSLCDAKPSGPVVEVFSADVEATDPTQFFRSCQDGVDVRRARQEITESNGS